PPRAVALCRQRGRSALRGRAVLDDLRATPSQGLRDLGTDVTRVRKGSVEHALAPGSPDGLQKLLLARLELGLLYEHQNWFPQARCLLKLILSWRRLSRRDLAVTGADQEQVVLGGG